MQCRGVWGSLLSHSGHDFVSSGGNAHISLSLVNDLCHVSGSLRSFVAGPGPSLYI